MGDFVAFSEDIDVGMEFLEHHGILGQKWGRKNGPPYPLGSGDHSVGEKRAAKAAGVKVGKSSGRGSLDALSTFGSRSKSAPKVKKEMTEEEKREAALEAVRKGDKKKIAKYAEYLTSQELVDADNRVRSLNNISREEPKASKEDVDKLNAIRSGDKEKVKEYADKMSYQELVEAMNKVDLTKKLNEVPPEPTVADKIDKAMNAIDRARGWAEKGIAAYNVMAKVYNSTHPNEKGWPEIHPSNNQSKEQKKEADVLTKLANNALRDTANNMQQAKEQNYQKKVDENLKKAKIDYKSQQEFNEWKEKQDKKNAPKEQKQSNQPQQQNNTPPQNQQPKQQPQTQPAPTNVNIRVFTDAVSQNQNVRMSDYSDMSYDDLIPDSVRDEMNRRVV